MADTKISDLPGLSGNFTGNEPAAIVQGGVTRQAPIAQYGGKVYNVENYGTIGGSTDNIAFQAAVDAAEADGGGRIYFPKNNYKISDSTKISSGAIQLIGPGFALDYISHACPNSPGWSIDSGKGAVIEGSVGTEIAFEFLTDAVADSSLAKEPLGLVQVSGLGFKNLNSAIVAGATNQFSFGAFVLENCAFDQMSDWAVNIVNAQDIVLKQFWGSECKRGIRIAQDHDACAPGTTNMTDFFLQLNSIQGAAADYAQRYGILLEVVGGVSNPFLDAVVIDSCFVWAIGDFPQDTIGIYCKGAAANATVNAPTINGAFDGDLNFPILLEHCLDAQVSFTSAADDLYGTLYPFTADNTTNTITAVGHTWEEGQPVFVDTEGGTLPAGLTARNLQDLVPYDYTDATNSIYYVTNPSGDTLQLATTDPNRYTGAVATFSDNGTGNLYICEAKAPLVKGIGAKRTMITNMFSSQWMQFDPASVPWGLNGLCVGFSFKSTLPLIGEWFDEGTAKSYSAGAFGKLSAEYNSETSGYGPTIDHARASNLLERAATTPLWMYSRISHRRTGYEYTSSNTVGADQLGMSICDPPGGGITLTLAAIGNTGAQADVGAVAIFENRTGVGTVTLVGGVGVGPGVDTIKWAANYVIPAVVGASVTIMASGGTKGGGPGNWVIVGSN